MTSKKGGLGRGLGALLTQTAAQYNKTQDTVVEIEVELIVPNRYQPRREFDIEALNELAESIKTYGILQPLIVRRIGDGYELIAGERRLRASKMVGLVKVPAIIREYTDAQMSEISIIENVQRENLNVIEEAQAYERLIKEFGHTQEVVAVKIGRSRSHISNILRLLKLVPEVRELVSKGQLTLGQARPLLAIENPIIQKQAAEMILSEGLSVRKVEAFINELKNSGLLATMTANMKALEENKNEFQTNVNQSTINNQSDIEKVEIKSEESKIVDNGAASDTINSELKTEKSKTSKADKKVEPPNIYIIDAENRLTEILGAKVKITTSKKFSRIQIDFSNEDELSRIIESFERSIKSSDMKNEETAISQATTKEEKIAALRKFSTQNFNI